MIFDGIPFLEAQDTLNSPVSSFIQFLEQKLKVRILYDLRKMFYGSVEFAGPTNLAKSLFNKNIISSFSQVELLPDEPFLYYWQCNYTFHKNSVSGGLSINNSSAMYAALAEALERYLWLKADDYFMSPIWADLQTIAKKGAYIAPRAFSGFSDEQRQNNTKYSFYENAKYHWIKARSLISDNSLYIPAQVISASVTPLTKPLDEPLIRQQVTTGLATWTTKNGARLNGILELIEREAYMIMWFNQFTLPKIHIDSLLGKNVELDTLLRRCDRNQLKVHVISMMTDAPTHAVCVVLEDLSAYAPKFTFGLKASASITEAVAGAIGEAVRARHIYRKHSEEDPWIKPEANSKIGHADRLYYWAMPENVDGLRFLIAGEEHSYSLDAPWENDTREQHLIRLLSWCKDKKMECLAVSLGDSNLNPTKLAVEVVVIPQLVPTHLNEHMQHLGSERIQTVPRSFGYQPLSKPHTATPHPYY